MSAPRCILPGTTYLLTRRCFGRHLFLRPSKAINQIFKFCLAVAAKKTGVQVHGFCVLSNHYHVVATDPHGNLPEFMHWLNEYVAKCGNAELGRWESFWAPGSYSCVALTDADDVVAKLAYVFTNPVEAGLVPNHQQWPGARSLPADMDGDPETVRRPEGFFRKKGSVPETATLQLVSPPDVDSVSSDWAARVRKLVLEREQEIQQRMNQEGRRFLGVRGILRQSPTSRPQAAEPRGGLDPRVACRDKWRRFGVLQRLKGFLDDYRDAWERYTRGDRKAVFPAGTYGMRVRFGVMCAGP